MLEIKNLHVKLADEDKPILNGVNLTVPKGQVHAIMGPNGSGKSTLAYVLAGREGYEVTDGEVLWNGEGVLAMEPDERAAKGVFLAFQYPMEIPGVATMTFLRTALNAVAQGARREGAHDAGVPQARARGGRSARHRRRDAEAAAQRRLLRRREEAHGDPADGRAGADAVRAGRDRLPASTSTPCASSRRASTSCAPRTGRCSSSPTTSGCLNYIVPDKVHVMADGRIQKTGGKELALELEKTGYAEFKSKAASSKA